MSITLKCSKHPQYRALLAPTANCPDCVKLYNTARCLSPGVVYPRDGVIKGRYYCNPAHCAGYWRNKADRDKHLASAYAILS